MSRIQPLKDFFYKNISVLWIVYGGDEMCGRLLLTTIEANADCSPWEFIAETRYWAVSSKSHLQETKISWSVTTIRRFTFNALPPTLVLSATCMILTTRASAVTHSKNPARNTWAINRHHEWCNFHQELLISVLESMLGVVSFRWSAA